MIEEILELYAKISPGHQFLLDNGRTWAAQMLPDWVEKGPKRQCFMNAGLLALSYPELTYVEGLALSATVPIPLSHAWVVDADGRVMDPTWDTPEACQYFGLAFRTEYLLDSINDKKIWGVMGEMIPRDLLDVPAQALNPRWHPNPVRLQR